MEQAYSDRRQRRLRLPHAYVKNSTSAADEAATKRLLRMFRRKHGPAGVTKR